MAKYTIILEDTEDGNSNKFLILASSTGHNTEEPSTAGEMFLSIMEHITDQTTGLEMTECQRH
jgi:hypothetical protein